MRDFGSWFSEQGRSEPEEVETHFWLTCTGCGKVELVSRAAFENGDAWYSENPESGDGLCYGSHFCLP